MPRPSGYKRSFLIDQVRRQVQENFGASGIRLRSHPRVFAASLSYIFSRGGD